jgi:hypothetical protein
MVATVEKIARDLAALDKATGQLGIELHQTYQRYLEQLARATHQQLVLAAYHVCTQGYPDVFLALTSAQKQQLLHEIQQLAHRCQADLPALLSSPQTFQTQQLETSAPFAPSLGEQSPAAGPSDFAGFDAAPLGESTPPPHVPVTPNVLIAWIQDLESEIQDQLRQASLAVNQRLQQQGILPKQMPESLLEVATKVEMSDMLSSVPNILTVRLGTLGDIDGDEDDSDSEDDSRDDSEDDSGDDSGDREGMNSRSRGFEGAELRLSDLDLAQIKRMGLQLERLISPPDSRSNSELERKSAQEREDDDESDDDESDDENGDESESGGAAAEDSPPNRLGKPPDFSPDSLKKSPSNARDARDAARRGPSPKDLEEFLARAQDGKELERLEFTPADAQRLIAKLRSRGRAEMLQVTAVMLRLGDIEFSDPSLSGQRNQIRQLASRLRSLGKQHKAKLKERAIASAQMAWRTAWSEALYSEKHGPTQSPSSGQTPYGGPTQPPHYPPSIQE